MKKIFTAACLVMFAAQSFGQNTATENVADNTQPALIDTFAGTVLVYNTPGVTTIQTEECKLAFAASVRSLTATPAAGYDKAIVGQQKAIQPLVSLQVGSNLYSFKRQWPVYASFFWRGVGVRYSRSPNMAPNQHQQILEPLQQLENRWCH